MITIKNHFFTQQEFDRKCPYSFLVKGYLETQIPQGTRYDLKFAVQTDENTYVATYDIFSSNGNYTAEVTCDVSNKEAYQYSFKKNGN